MYSFAKYHGLGNDFILVNGLSADVAGIDAQAAVAWCDRHTGIGADGLILLLPSEQVGGRMKMKMFNSDGSEAPMCGNGLRCLVMFAHDEGLISASAYAVETPAGLMQVRLESDPHGRVGEVWVDMGRPGLLARDVPTTLLPGDRGVIEAPLTVTDQAWRVTALYVGNPHCVIFVPCLEEVDICRWGAAIERLPAFPHGINVMFAQVLEPGRVRVMPWERGAGATQACGTGACAVVVAGVLTGQTARALQALMPGGALRVAWEADSEHVMMCGPAVRAFHGQIT